MRKNIWWIISVTIIVVSCQKDENNFDPNNLKPQADFKYYDEIDQIKLVDNSSDPEFDTLKLKWTANSDLIDFTNESASITYFPIPDISEPLAIDITLTANDGNSENSVSKSITLPILTNIRKWGLGTELMQEKSNNANYNYYLDQMNTGTYSSINCGPTVVTMAIKWADETFTKTAEDARNTYRAGGGWWYTSDIINYLNDYNISNTTISLNNVNQITTEIDNDHIVILCVDMYFISDEIKDEWHINKFYSTNSEGWGHFILVKGYKVVNNELFFECYDPYSFGNKYSDNTLKGKDRYYLASDIDITTNIWWDYAIVVSSNAIKSARGVDVNTISHQSGQ